MSLMVRLARLEERMTAAEQRAQSALDALARLAARIEAVEAARKPRKMGRDAD